MSPNAPETREKPEPEEGAEPVPRLVWVAIIGLVAWGFAYFLLYSGSPGDVGGDMRTAPMAAAADPVIDGAALYGSRCAACHQANGAGIPGAFPPLAGSPWPTGDAIVPIRIVLGGLEGPIDVLGTTYQGVMPAFAEQLSDAEIAAVVTHIRGSFGNTAGPVTTAQVAEVRAASAARTDAWTATALETP